MKKFLASANKVLADLLRCTKMCIKHEYFCGNLYLIKAQLYSVFLVVFNVEGKLLQNCRVYKGIVTLFVTPFVTLYMLDHSKTLITRHTRKNVQIIFIVVNQT